MEQLEKGLFTQKQNFKINHPFVLVIAHISGNLEEMVCLFPGVPPFEVFLGISEAVGHLEILKEKEMVKVKERDGKDYYSLEK